ncbi:1846_t:CDS:2 [Entrophospora sp. SA101]|nr:7999_t:CDS:2 [Entrophospora sp. SA101]CAJ0884833.1 1846_t:CDS:2 [Entrophospora sp. SA101]
MVVMSNEQAISYFLNDISYVDLEHDDLYNQAQNQLILATMVMIFEQQLSPTLQQSDQLLLEKSAIDDDDDLFDEIGLANTVDDDDKIL